MYIIITYGLELKHPPKYDKKKKKKNSLLIKKNDT